jgi:hypothetical protein
MPATTLLVFLKLDVNIKISQTDAIMEINVTTMLVIRNMVAHLPKLTVMIMITVLMTAVTHLRDANIHHTTVMTKTNVLLKNVSEINVIMNELTVTITMLVLTNAVRKIPVVNTPNTNATTITLVLKKSATHTLAVSTPL